MRRLFVMLSCVTLLAACGGGGGTSTSSNPPAPGPDSGDVSSARVIFQCLRQVYFPV